MGIQGLYNGDVARAGNQITNFFETAKALLSNIAQGFSTGVGSIWDGGFAGVSDFEGLKEAVTRYAERLTATLAEAKGNSQKLVEKGLKGRAGYEAGVFLTETINLLTAYVNVVKKWNDELDEAYDKYTHSDSALAQNVVANDVADVREAAKNIDIG